MTRRWNTGLPVEHGLEKFAARAVRHLVIDHQRAVGMSGSVHDRCSTMVERRMLSVEQHIKTIANEPLANRQLERLVGHVRAEVCLPMAEVQRSLSRLHDLDVLDHGIVVDRDLR